ncbi:MAG: response regulator transcription factor, partial [Anaerolineales bacterium]
LKLVSQGYSNQEIADILVIEEVTVRTHVSHILRKLQLANRVQATLYALKEGITSIESFNDTDTK